MTEGELPDLERTHPSLSPQEQMDRALRNITKIERSIKYRRMVDIVRNNPSTRPFKRTVSPERQLGDD